MGQIFHVDLQQRGQALHFLLDKCVVIELLIVVGDVEVARFRGLAGRARPVKVNALRPGMLQDERRLNFNNVRFSVPFRPAFSKNNEEPN